MSKIAIDFKFSENLVVDYNAKLPCDDDVSLLLIYFIVPIYFSIDGFGLFTHTPKQYDLKGKIILQEPEKIYLPDGSEIVQSGNKKTDWFEMPLLHFATNGLIEVMKINNNEIGKYSIPDTSQFIYYEPINTNVKVYSTINDYYAIVDKTLLLDNYIDFVHRVQKFMKENFQDLQASRLWSLWLEETNINHLMKPLERIN